VLAFEFIAALLLGLGLHWIASALLLHDRTLAGRRGLKQVGKWQRQKQDLWSAAPVQRLTDLASRLVYLDPAAEERLERQLSRAGIPVTPEQFTARKIVILGIGLVPVLFCVLLKFWLGVVFAALFTILLLMRQKEQLTSRLQKRDEEIAWEMPRFVRTICQNLRTNRDICAALQAYRKVAGNALGEELDILLSHLRTGGVVQALQLFQTRIGSEEAFRLCSTLIEIDRGIDQTATLEYLADDMARTAKLQIQKQLSTKPGKMRRTYLPAVGVCVALIVYVLVVFTMNQVNTLF
jgi:Flp pilus assembly protein TadB